MLEGGSGEQKFVWVRKIMFAAIWQTALDHVLMKRQRLSPRVRRSAGRGMLRESAGRFGSTILYVRCVRGLRIRLHNAKSGLLKLPVMEKRSLC